MKSPWSETSPRRWAFSCRQAASIAVPVTPIAPLPVSMAATADAISTPETRPADCIAMDCRSMPNAPSHRDAQKPWLSHPGCSYTSILTEQEISSETEDL